MRCTDCGTQVRPVLVSDIDGTLADYHNAFSLFASTYWDIPVQYPMTWNGVGNFEDYLKLTRQQYREAKLAYRQGGSKRWMPVFRGVSEMMNEMAARGVEVWVCTTRPWQRLDNIDPDTREWLRRNKIKVSGLLFGDDKYDQLLQRVDLDRIVGVVEDLPEQFDVAKEMGLPVFQVKRVHNSAPVCERAPAGTLPQITKWVCDRLEQWEDKIYEVV